MLRRIAFALCLVCAAAPGFGQTWPAKTVRIVVPFGAGSTPDIVARVVADELAKKYPASNFVIENKAGASGNLGTDAVAKAEPDGATLGISIGGPLAAYTMPLSNRPSAAAKEIRPPAPLGFSPPARESSPALRAGRLSEPRARPTPP